MAEISKTTDNALRLLLALGQHESGSASAAELARSVAANRTVVARLLETLRRRGFVLRRADGSYALGPAVANLGRLVEPSLRAAAGPAMAALARETGETVVLWLLDGDEAIAVDQVVGDRDLVRVEFPLNSTASLELASSGRVLLAHQSESFIARILAKAAEPEILRRRLDEIHALGYAVSHDELQRGVHGAAAPILGADGRPSACLAIIVPTARADALESHVDDLLRAVRALSEDQARANQPPSQAALAV